MKTTLERDGWFTLLLALGALGGGYAAYRFRDLSLAVASAVVALFVLHLLSLRGARSRCVELQVLERLLGELTGSPGTETVVARRFGLGTVALIENEIEPEPLFRAMVRAREKPGTSFRDYALRKELLTKEQLQKVVEARKEGRFLRDEILAARHRLKEIRGELVPEGG